MPLSYPYWFGNQLKFDPAIFPGYTGFPFSPNQPPQINQPPPQPGGIFSPPKSLFNFNQNGQGGGAGDQGSSFDGDQSSPFGDDGVPGPVGGIAQSISDFASNPASRGMAMAAGLAGVPGVGLALGLANTAAQYSMAPPDTFSLGNFFSSLFGGQPTTETLTQMTFDPMGNFQGVDVGPVNQNEEGGLTTGGGFDTGPPGPDPADGSFGGSFGDEGPGPGPGPGPSDGSPAGGADSGAGGGDWAKGGMVTKERLMGMDPPGPDDGYGALDTGEFVLTASAVKKLGPGNVAKLNAGKFDKKTLMKVLTAKNPKIRVRQKK